MEPFIKFAVAMLHVAVSFLVSLFKSNRIFNFGVVRSKAAVLLLFVCCNCCYQSVFEFCVWRSISVLSVYALLSLLDALLCLLPVMLLLVFYVSSSRCRRLVCSDWL